jgi:hypothetical protein
VSARAFDRWRLTLALAIPSVGGLAYLAAFGAPTRLIAVNAGALAVGLIWVMFGRLPEGQRARLALGGGATLVLFVPLLTGPIVGGVARWLPAGPVSLHSSALLLPLITVIAARERAWGPALLALAGAALALQPDAAALAGLAAAGVVLAAIHRSPAFALVTASSAALALFTFNAGTLEPQVFTEGVLAQVAAQSWLAAAALGAALFLLPLWLLPIREETRPLAALLVALGAMAVIAPFPFPLIGYGAAPILGFALAFGAAGIAARA